MRWKTDRDVLVDRKREVTYTLKDSVISVRGILERVGPLLGPQNVEQERSYPRAVMNRRCSHAGRTPGTEREQRNTTGSPGGESVGVYVKPKRDPAID